MAIAPPLSPDEPFRLRALRQLRIIETPLEERFERITRLARKLLNTAVATVSLVEADRQWFKSVQGFDATETPRDISFCGHAILEPEIMVVEDARRDRRFCDNPLVLRPPNVVFYAGCPIRAPDGSPVGTLCVSDTQPRSLSDEERQDLLDLAGLAEVELRAASASAVQAALIEDATAERRQALIDQLTRVWNREGIMAIVDQALRSVAAGGAQGAAFVMTDLDCFKQINDTYGHPAGDGVLRTFTKRVLGALRESDVVGRVGGDEFLLVLHPCDTESSAVKVAERVRSRIISNPFAVGRLTVPITASFGVHFFEAGSNGTVEDVISAADAALYASKRGGRDHVESHAPATKPT